MTEQLLQRTFQMEKKLFLINSISVEFIDVE